MFIQNTQLHQVIENLSIDCLFFSWTHRHTQIFLQFFAWLHAQIKQTTNQFSHITSLFSLHSLYDRLFFYKKVTTQQISERDMKGKSMKFIVSVPASQKKLNTEQKTEDFEKGWRFLFVHIRLTALRWKWHKKHWKTQTIKVQQENMHFINH